MVPIGGPVSVKDVTKSARGYQRRRVVVTYRREQRWPGCATGSVSSQPIDELAVQRRS